MSTDRISIIPAQWDAPQHIRAFTTLRYGGTSQAPCESLNLATHVGDRYDAVIENRRRVRRQLELPAEPKWLNQVHSAVCVNAEDVDSMFEADGVFTDDPGVVCAVLTADCLPLFVCDSAGERVGLFHVGWRGLVQGMVEEALSHFDDVNQVFCWLGPAIGQDAFEIGPEVYEELADENNDGCFRPSSNPGRWLADLYQLVDIRLKQNGVEQIHYDPDVCTYQDSDRFFSHRRDKRCGRMASLIWMEAEAS